VVIEVLYGVLAFLIGILIAYIADKIHSSIKRRLAGRGRIKERIRRLQEELERVEPERGRYILIGPEIIQLLARYDVVDRDEIPSQIASVLEENGFIRRCGTYGYIVNREAIRQYVLALQSIRLAIDHICDDDVVKYLLSKYGILNIIIYRIDREEGLIQIYRASGNTKLALLIDEDSSIIDNMFMLGPNISTANIHGIRVVVHSTPQYFIIAEIASNADQDIVLGALKKLEVKDNIEELRDALMTLHKTAGACGCRPRQTGGVGHIQQ